MNARPDPSATQLEGTTVSPGIVTGPARVILHTNNHEPVLPGEILVAPFTDPAWTPYFNSAAGVVIDQGGVLSHGSIVARELGLPAITNPISATQLDANSGRITILSRARG